MQFSFLKQYGLAGACYGIARKSIDLCMNDAEITVERSVEKNVDDGQYACVSRNRPMPVTEGLAVVLVHACVCAAYSPYFVSCDLSRAEARLRGIDIDPSRGKDDPELSMMHHVFA